MSEISAASGEVCVYLGVDINGSSRGAAVSHALRVAPLVEPSHKCGDDCNSWAKGTGRVARRQRQALQNGLRNVACANIRRLVSKRLADLADNAREVFGQKKSCD